MILQRSFERLKKDSRVLREAKTLIGKGHNISIIIFGDKSSKPCEKLNGINVRIARIRRFDLLEKFNPFKTQLSVATALLKIFTRILFFVVYGVQYFFVTLRILLEENARVYHAHDFETLLLGYIASRAKKAKLIYDSHELWMESRKFPLISKKIKIRIIKRIFIILENFLIKRSDKVITVNESIAKYLAHRYKIEKPVVISNFSEYSNVEISNILREKLALDENKNIVLYQGSIIDGRGLEKLIECSKYLNENVIIVIMGYGHLKRKLQKKVERENFNRVKLLDAVPPDVIINYVSSADIGISPIQNICLSYYYSTPNKVWECIMAGIPFAVSDFPEMRKLAIDLNMGVVFDPENSKSIANAIHELLNTEVYALKRENVLKARKKYSWEEEKLKLIKLYEELNFQIKEINQKHNSNISGKN